MRCRLLLSIFSATAIAVIAVPGAHAFPSLSAALDDSGSQSGAVLVSGSGMIGYSREHEKHVYQRQQMIDRGLERSGRFASPYVDPGGTIYLPGYEAGPEGIIVRGAPRHDGRLRRFGEPPEHPQHRLVPQGFRNY
jgi:hypothetical protein